MQFTEHNLELSIMERFEKAEQYRNKIHKHYYISQENERAGTR